MAGIAGYGLRRLESWVRIPVAILCGLGLLGGVQALANPVAGRQAAGSAVGTVLGMAINVYIIYLVWCAKGKFVCSDEYHAIIAETPHIKYKTSIIVKIFAGLLVLIVVCGVLSFLFLPRP